MQNFPTAIFLRLCAGFGIRSERWRNHYFETLLWTEKRDARRGEIHLEYELGAGKITFLSFPALESSPQPRLFQPSSISIPASVKSQIHPNSNPNPQWPRLLQWLRFPLTLPQVSIQHQQLVPQRTIAPASTPSPIHHAQNPPLQPPASCANFPTLLPSRSSMFSSSGPGPKCIQRTQEIKWIT